MAGFVKLSNIFQACRLLRTGNFGSPQKVLIKPYGVPVKSKCKFYGSWVPAVSSPIDSKLMGSLLSLLPKSTARRRDSNRRRQRRRGNSGSPNPSKACHFDALCESTNCRKGSPLYVIETPSGRKSLCAKHCRKVRQRSRKKDGLAYRRLQKEHKADMRQERKKRRADRKNFELAVHRAVNSARNQTIRQRAAYFRNRMLFRRSPTKRIAETLRFDVNRGYYLVETRTPGGVCFKYGVSPYVWSPGREKELANREKIVVTVPEKPFGIWASYNIRSAPLLIEDFNRSRFEPLSRKAAWYWSKLADRGIKFPRAAFCTRKFANRVTAFDKLCLPQSYQNFVARMERKRVERQIDVHMRRMHLNKINARKAFYLQVKERRGLVLLNQNRRKAVLRYAKSVFPASSIPYSVTDDQIREYWSQPEDLTLFRSMVNEKLHLWIRKNYSFRQRLLTAAVRIESHSGTLLSLCRQCMTPLSMPHRECTGPHAPPSEEGL